MWRGERERRLKCCKIKGNLICIYTELDFHVQIDIKNSTEYSNSAQRKIETLKNRDNRAKLQNEKKIYRKLNYMRQQSWQNMYFHFSHEIISIKRVFLALHFIEIPLNFTQILVLFLNVNKFEISSKIA